MRTSIDAHYDLGAVAHLRHVCDGLRADGRGNKGAAKGGVVRAAAAARAAAPRGALAAFNGVLQVGVWMSTAVVS